MVWCMFFISFSFSSYSVTQGRKKYAVKVLEDNRNLLIIRKEIAFQIRSKCAEIVDVIDMYYYDDKLWVGSIIHRDM